MLRAKYSATSDTRKLSGICLYSAKVHGIAVNQGGTTDKLLFVLGRNSVEGVFYFLRKGVFMILLTKRWRS